MIVTLFIILLILVSCCCDDFRFRRLDTFREGNRCVDKLAKERCNAVDASSSRVYYTPHEACISAFLDDSLDLSFCSRISKDNSYAFIPNMVCKLTF